MAKPRVMSRRRSWLVWGLVVLATVLALVASMTVWTKRQLLDTDNWTSSSAKILADDDVRAALSSRLVNLLNERVDIQAQLEERLPARAEGAAPFAAAAVLSATGRVVDTFLASAQAQELWERANRRAHGAIVNVLEGNDAGRISTANGDVVLDVRPMLGQIAQRLGIEDRVKQNESPTSGQIVLLRSDQLDVAQKAVQGIKALTVWLAVAVLALYGLAIYLATGRRRAVLMGAGAGFVFVGLVLLAVRRVAGNAVVDSLVHVEANRPAVRTIWLVETDLMKDLAVGLLAYGLLAIAGGFLAGPSRAAVATRRALAPTFRERPVAVYATAVILFLIAITWGPFGNERQLIGTLIIAALFFGGLEVWRRQTVREFPPGGPPDAQPEASQPALDT
jgi:hypothetical protein